MDDSVELRKIDILGLGIIGQGNGVLGFGALTKLGYFLILVSIVVV